jgi:hypothetical protein
MVFESMFASTYKMLWPGRLQLNASLISIIRSIPAVLDDFSNESYVVGVTPQGQVLVCLLVGATCRDQLKAFLHALVMLRLTDGHPSKQSFSVERVSLLCRRVHQQLKELFPNDNNQVSKSKNSISLTDKLIEKGWDLELRLYVGFSRRRASWTFKSE